MSQTSPHQDRQIIEKVIIWNDEDAWRAFIAHFADLLSAVHASWSSTVPREEFQSWFPGWLYQRRKLHSLYRALTEKRRAQALKNAADEDAFIRNYLATITRTGLVEFHRENKSTGSLRLSELEVSRSGAKDVGDQAERIRTALRQLEVGLRIPFWLRHFRALGPLLEEDSHWLAELNQTSTTEVDVVIKREFDANPDAQFPISSALIGALLDLPPDSVGKYSAVDQRVRRACIVLRTILTPNDEDSQT